MPRKDLSLPICTIKSKLYNYMWEHFIQNFDDTNVHSFQYNFPCCHGVTALMTPLHRELTFILFLYFPLSLVLSPWQHLPVALSTFICTVKD